MSVGPFNRSLVRIQRGNVVLTMSPPRARQLARVVEAAGPHRDDWLRDVVRLMLAAVDRFGLAARVAPRLSRRQFLHDWQLQASPGAQPLPQVSVPTAEGADLAVAAGQDAELEQEQHQAEVVRASAERAARLADRAVGVAAECAAEAAATARTERSVAVAQAADAVAARVASAAAAVQSEADAAALTVAHAAFDAALLIASTVPAGSERDAALTATLVATAVSAVAVKAAAVTAAARADVAREAAAAASAAAEAAADAALLVDLEVTCAAEAVLAVATATATALARQIDAQATALALTHR